jgi:hypothetical protein
MSEMPVASEAGRVARSLALIPLTLGAAALGLATLDRVPGILLDLPPRTTRFESVDEARRLLPAGLLLPAYFPEALVWPPARVLGRTRWPEALLLAFDSRNTGEAAFLLCQSWSSRRCPASLLTPLDVFHEVETRVGARPARVAAGRAASGEVWEQVELDWDGRQVTLRLRGRTLDLLRVAESLREGRP